MFPKQLSDPIAIAKDYLADPIPLVSSPITDDQASKVSGDPIAADAEENVSKHLLFCTSFLPKPEDSQTACAIS